MKVLLLGELGEKFGSEWEMSVKYPRDVFRLINCQREGFLTYLRECEEKNVGFTIQRGEVFIEEEELELSLTEDDLIISAVPEGAEGVGKILAAVAIIAVIGFTSGFGATGWGAAGTTLQQGIFWTGISLATNLAITGIQEILAPGPEQDANTPDSYLFSGPVNAIREGLPVPLLYGELIVGGAPINVSYTTKEFNPTGYEYVQPGTGNNSFWPTVNISGNF